ncbi:MAG: ATP-dependent Clp protease ATP-binding subunit [bacterium]|nr:ATP-dependent Clp protease ATP-binding subunit [bacterium]
MNQEIYFNEPRLKLTSSGRFLVSFITYLFYGVAVASAVVFLLSDLIWLQSIGFLLAAFLLDRLLNLRKADRSIIAIGQSGKINTADYLSPSAYAAIERSLEKSLLAGGDFFLYLIDNLIGRSEIKSGLTRLDIDFDEFTNKLAHHLQNVQFSKLDKDVLLLQIEKLTNAAFRQAVLSHNSQIDPKDIFAALSDLDDESVARLLRLFNIDAGDLENALIYSRFKKFFWGLRRLPASLTGLTNKSFGRQRRIMNRAWTARPTPTLDSFSNDLTDAAHSEKIGFLIGHNDEYGRLVDVLARPSNPNVVLVGDPGTGKSTLVAHLAYRIVHDTVPEPLFDKRLVALEIGQLVAGAAEGELQERINKIINEIITAGNIILYIPDIHNLIKTSGQLHLSAADIIMPAIKGNAFSVIGATYPREYKQYIESNNDFTSSFESIKVKEISEDESIKFLVYDSIILEKQYKIIISFAAIKNATRLARKYFRQKLLPASAEDLLKESLTNAVKRKDKILNGSDVVDVAQRKINIPLESASGGEAKRLLNLEGLIHERLIDQEAAVRAVARSLREYRSGLSRRGGPIATFLFVGPTGVGKTELSKILSKIQFGSSDAMIRFDMSEYQNKDSLRRFIGLPDGSIGGTLTDAILERPYSLILLDEFEKAHPDILNLFLQVFDDGRLTDSLGRTVDFQNTIIIATSNAHSNFIKDEIENGVDIKNISDNLKKKLTEIFRPELLNRFSGVIVFRNLLPEHIEAIARLHLKDLAKTVGEQGIGISFDESAIKQIAAIGYDPIFGARPLRNAISENLRSILAEKILGGEFVKGSQVRVVYDREFKFIANNSI